MIITSDQGLYKLDPDAARLSKHPFVPVTEIDGHRIDQAGKIKALYNHDHNMLIGETDKHAVILKKGNNNTFDWVEAALNKIQGTPTQTLLEPNGVIWISSSEGVYRFDSAIKKNYQTRYHAMIRNVTTNENEILFHGTNYYTNPDKQPPRKTALDQPQELIPTLPYKNNSLAFKYAAAFFEQPNYLRFRTKLEGYDQNWSQWAEKNYKEYTNLPEGSYRFWVQAINIFDHQSIPAYYRFVIEPPWHRTIAAYIGYIILFLFFLFAGIRINTRRLVAAKKKLEQLVNQRTQELREKKNQLEDSLHKLKHTQNKLLDASWKAGMADVASGVLHNIGNALNSVNVSQNLIQDRLKASKITNLPKITMLTKDTFIDSVAHLPDPERGSKTIDYLEKLAAQLSNEHNQNVQDIHIMENSLFVIKKLVAMQGIYTQTKNKVEPILPSELMETALDTSQLISDPNVQIERGYQYENTIRAERLKVIQILAHLINNAHNSVLGHHTDKKKIILKIEKTGGDRVLFSIIDNGAGFDADSLSDIFSCVLDQNLDQQRLQFHSSANAAKSMGGEMMAQSEGPGRGACFSLSLPIGLKA